MNHTNNMGKVSWFEVWQSTGCSGSHRNWTVVFLFLLKYLCSTNHYGCVLWEIDILKHVSGLLQSPWVLIDTLLLFHSDIDILLLEIGWLKRKVLEIEVTTTPWLERKCLKALFYTKQKLRLERRRVYLVGVIIIWHFSIVSFDLSVLILCISQNSQLRNQNEIIE